MFRTVFSALLLVSPAMADVAQLPTPAMFVAWVELSIERCSSQQPENAEKFSQSRASLKTALRNADYAAILRSEDYLPAKSSMDRDMKLPLAKGAVDFMCPRLLAWVQSPPTEAFVREQ